MAKCGTKVAWTAPFDRIWPENGIPAQTGMIRTGFGPQNRPKPAKVAASNKIWIKKTWFYTIFDANAWGMYPYFLKFPCKKSASGLPKNGRKTTAEKYTHTKTKKEHFWAKDKFVLTSGEKKIIFLTKNKFVHTSEKMSVFPENMRKPEEKTTFLKKHVDFFVHFWLFFGWVLSGHFFRPFFFGRFIIPQTKGACGLSGVLTCSL